jgi:hypothetical protein
MFSGHFILTESDVTGAISEVMRSNQDIEFKWLRRII